MFYLDKVHSSVILLAFIVMYGNDLSCCRILKGWENRAAYLCLVKTASQEGCFGWVFFS